MLELKQLPYIDSDTPAEGQKSIKWIQNGTLLVGGTKEDPRSGNLNEDSVSIQKNIVVLDENIHILKDSLEGAQGDIENINIILGQVGSTDLINQVNKNTNDIANNSNNITVNSDKIDINTTDIRTVHECLGDKIPQSVDRTVTEDIVWVKNEIGQYSDKDVNGLDVAGNVASGLKAKFEQVAILANSNQQSINSINEQLTEGDFNGIKTDINSIRTELGPSNEVVEGMTVYSRIRDVESSTQSLKETTDLIISAIDLNGGKIIETVNDLGNKFNTLNNDVNGTNGIQEKLDGVYNNIWDENDGLIKATTDNRISIDLLESNVGVNDEQGLRKRIKDLETATGSTEDPDPVSLEGRLRTLTSIQNEQASTIQDLQNEVADLKQKVEDLISKLPSP